MTQVIETSDRRRRRTMRAATPFAALLVAALLVWQGSNAAFSAATSNDENAWATGDMYLENNGGGASFAVSTDGLFDEQTLEPGDSGFKCLTVRSTGSLDGDLRLFTENADGAPLGDYITLTIDAATATSAVQANCTGYTGGTSGALYDETLNELPAAYVDAAASSVALAGGTELVVYRIGWTVEDAPNALMGESTQADLVWEVR